MTPMPPVLHVGFNQYVVTDHIEAILDATTAEAGRIIHSAKEENRRKVLDVTKNRARKSLIILRGDRYIVTFVPIKQLLRRLGLVETEND